MNTRDDQFDELISRSLDGALSEDEQLAFDREVLRDVEKRRELEAWQQADRIAGRVVCSETPERDVSAEALDWIRERPQRRRLVMHRGWFLVPGAIAAALLAVFVARMNESQQPTSVADNSRQPFVGQVTDTPVSPQDVGVFTVSETPKQKLQRNLYRDVIAVPGEDGRIYWIETDWLRTMRQGDPESQYERAGREL